MSHFLESPRITAVSIDPHTHTVGVIDSLGKAVTVLPPGASVLEVWAAHVPSGVSADRAYASFSWMRPATSLPLKVNVGSVTGHDPSRGPVGRWHLFYKARWMRDGMAVSGWSNVAVVDDGEPVPAANTQSRGTSGGRVPFWR